MNNNPPKRLIKILEVDRTEYKVCELKFHKEKTIFGLSEDTWRIHFYEEGKCTLEKED